eukprot:COSAG01_NODE_24_length_37608_cov_19.303154_34_plen_55_part_00
METAGQGFLSVHGAAFYGFARNEATITLDKVPFTVPGAIDITVRRPLRPFGRAF